MFQSKGNNFMKDSKFEISIIFLKQCGFCAMMKSEKINNYCVIFCIVLIVLILRF